MRYGEQRCQVFLNLCIS